MTHVGSHGKVRFMNQIEFQNLLRMRLGEKQAKNPSYSIRAFAKTLGMGSGSLSQILAGKRSLTAKSIQRVLDLVHANPIERSKVSKIAEKPLFAQTLLKADQYFILSEWYYLAILNLIRTQDFKSEPAHIGKRLGIDRQLVKQALDRLERSGLIKIAQGKITRTEKAITSSDGEVNLAIRKSHYETLDRARHSMESHPFESFDTSYITFAFEQAQMKEATQKIRQFEQEFGDQFSTSKKADQVYRLAVQFFSLSNPEPQTLKSKEKRK